MLEYRAGLSVFPTMGYSLVLCLPSILHPIKNAFYLINHSEIITMFLIWHELSSERGRSESRGQGSSKKQMRGEKSQTDLVKQSLDRKREYF